MYYLFCSVISAALFVNGSDRGLEQLKSDTLATVTGPSEKELRIERAQARRRARIAAESRARKYRVAARKKYYMRRYSNKYYPAAAHAMHRYNANKIYQLYRCVNNLD